MILGDPDRTHQMTPEEEEDAFRLRYGTSSGTAYTPEESDDWPWWKVWANNAVGVVVWVIFIVIPVAVALWFNSFLWTQFLPWSCCRFGLGN